MKSSKARSIIIWTTLVLMVAWGYRAKLAESDANAKRIASIEAEHASLAAKQIRMDKAHEASDRQRGDAQLAFANYVVEKTKNHIDWNAKVTPLLDDAKVITHRMDTARALWLGSLTDDSREQWAKEHDDAKAQLEAIMAKIKAIPKPPPLELVP